jgi:3-deoxy-7-phosphoheptulonate synthase
MIVIMKPRCSQEQINHVVRLLDEMGCDHWVIESSKQKVVEVLGARDHLDRHRLMNAPMVDRVLEKSEPILAADRSPDDRTREIPLGATATIGGGKIAVIAGPCSVETESQLMDIAAAVKEAGGVGLRGGAFKPRTSPYSFQGLGEQGLEMLALAREKTGLAIITEVMSTEHVDLVAKYADVLQVGSRSMHSTPLLAAVGRQNKPVLLKRGWSASLEELLMAAEYIMRAGNSNVILCERGIRTHETHTRNTLALAVVPEVKRISTLPIIVDPSHGTGRRDLVTPMSNAAIACGADGLLIEVHRDPDIAWSDGDQSLDLDQFRALMTGLRPFAAACDRVV